MNGQIFLFLLALFLCFFFAISQKKSVRKTSPAEEIPTFFFHGYAGTKNSFKTMIQRLEKKEQAKLTTQIIVTKDGELHIKKKKSTSKRPLIQVIFEENKRSISNQEQWITSIFIWAKKQGMTKINVIGHSMGGVSSLHTLLNQPEKNFPEVSHFISLGANFNSYEKQELDETASQMLENGPRNQTAFFKQLHQQLIHFPKHTQWLNIGGLIKEGDVNEGDGIVPLNSALGLTAFAHQNKLNYQYAIIKGPLAQHSMLHENPEVDALVAQFLWKN